MNYFVTSLNETVCNFGGFLDYEIDGWAEVVIASGARVDGVDWRLSIKGAIAATLLDSSPNRKSP